MKSRPKQKDRLTVRLGDTGTKLATAAKASARTESEIVRVAVNQFLSANSTPASINSALAEATS